MDDKISSLTTKVISAIRPVTAMLTFARRPLQAGGPEGIMNYYKDEVIPNWHAPTLSGFSTALGADLGMGIVNALVGQGIQYVGGIAGVGIVTKVGGAIKAGGEGQAIGGLADMVVHAHEFNPGPALMGGGRAGSRDRGFRGSKSTRNTRRGGRGRSRISSAPGAGTHRGAPRRQFK